MSALLAARRRRAGAAPTAPTTTVLDVVIPVYNEEAQLAASVERVLEHLRTMPWSLPGHDRRQRQHRPDAR